MCILNTLRGDSKLEMGNGKRPLDIRGGGVKVWMLKSPIIVENEISLFPISCHFQILNNTQN